MAEKESFNSYIETILKAIKSNDNLMKLLYYNTPDALNQPNLDIKTKQDLIYKNIFPYSFIPNIIDTEASYINMSFRNFRQIPNSRVYQAGKIIFFLTCHKNLWETDLGLRPLCMMDEMAKIFINSKGLGMGELKFVDSTEVWMNDKLGGYNMVFEITDFCNNLPR